MIPSSPAGFVWIVGGAAFVAALVLTHVASLVARRIGFLDQPGPRKIHEKPVPYGGGVAVAAVVWAGLLIPLQWYFSHVLGSNVGSLSWTPPHQTFGWPMRTGALLVLALGLADDRWRLKPRLKLAGQALAALAVVLGSGIHLELFDLPAPVSIFITVLWIVGITNAFNLLDHMDGLCAGTAALIGAALLWIALQTGQDMLVFLLTPFTAACLGFLVHNFAPARIFLGDAGSQFIGFWLACLSVSFTFYKASFPLYTYLVPLLLLAVPLYDTASVVLIRLRNRKPVWQGDTNHFAHRLVALGLSRRQAVLVVYGLTAYTGVSAALLYHVGRAGAPLVLAQVLLTFALLASLETAGRRRAA